MALFTALAIVFSYIEALIPFNFGIPGIKLGVANIGIIIALYILGNREAIVINIIRIFVISLFFGNIYTFFFSIVGGVLSTVAMIVIKKFKIFNILSVSIIGAVMHNVGQLIVAVIVVRRFTVAFYGPVLVIAGIITGMLIGTVSGIIIKKVRLEKML
ncbi:MAG: Gx transporter family protein [Lachnospiraceae bacterium]|nr:Gx transporter family protein [Lachnospiraceae bacterium]